MKRTAIISVGQVYLHAELNEYLVVTKANRGNISFAGTGFNGMNEVDTFLERFGPVSPDDLDHQETSTLKILVGNQELLTGWIEREEDEE